MCVNLIREFSHIQSISQVVICAVSGYFAQMMDLALPEIQHHAVVDITFQILSELIKFAYTSRITITGERMGI